MRKYVNASAAPSKQERKKPKLDSYKEFLHQRMLEDGIYNGERLLDKIRQLGYTGGKTI